MGKIERSFIQGNAVEIFNDLLEEIGDANLSIVNLECPLVSNRTPVNRPGALLAVPVDCIRGISAAKWKLLNLANNHSFDHGAQGLRETIQTIRQVGLGVVGAGQNIQEAQTPFITQIAGQRIIIYSMAEHEYSIADEQTPGANPLDIIRCVQAIRRYKQGGMFIVLIHGGLEFYPYPPPEMVRKCRFLVEMGADAVICCHTHCPLPWEVHANRPIVYGLGNLVFEATKPRLTSWYEGYLAKLVIQDGQVGLDILPYVQSKDHSGVKLMDPATRERFFAEMATKRDQLQDEAFLRNRWREHCRQRREDYLCDLFGYNRIMRKLRPLLFSKVHSKQAVMGALHLTQCESHREVLDTLFRDQRLNK